MAWFFIYYLFRIIWSWSWLFIYLWLFASSLCWTKLSSISSLNFINQFILHSISRFISPWTWNNFIININQSRKSIIIIIFFDGFTFKYSRLYLFKILTRTNISSLLRFTDKSFTWYTKWTLLTIVWFEHFYSWCYGNLICSRTWCCVIDVFNWIIIWRIVSDMSWRWSLLWVYTTLCWVLCDSWLFYILFYCSSIRNMTFSLIHGS